MRPQPVYRSRPGLVSRQWSWVIDVAAVFLDDRADLRGHALSQAQTERPSATASSVIAWKLPVRCAAVDIAHLQDVIERTFGERDRARGVPSSVAWLAEEVGELAQAIRKGTPDQQLHEFADVLAWVASLANQMGIDLVAALDRYVDGCPRCASIPCGCPTV